MPLSSPPPLSISSTARLAQLCHKSRQAAVCGGRRRNRHDSFGGVACLLRRPGGRPQGGHGLAALGMSQDKDRGLVVRSGCSAGSRMGRGRAAEPGEGTARQTCSDSRRRSRERRLLAARQNARGQRARVRSHHYVAPAPAAAASDSARRVAPSYTSWDLGTPPSRDDRPPARIKASNSTWPQPGPVARRRRPPPGGGKGPTLAWASPAP